MSDFARLLPELDAIVRHAGKIAVDSRAEATREFKPDGSIVTNGDRAVETYLRDVLTKLVPGSNVWGEEFGHAEPGPGGLWLLDPIDGTSNYSFGSPLWGVSIGLYAEGHIALGAISLPDLNEVYLAARGAGATMNGQKLPRIKPGEIQPYELVSYNENIIRAMGGRKLPGKMRVAGAVVVDGVFVAMQRYRGLIGHREKLYDIAASLCLLEELDADIRYGSGAPLDLDELLQDKKIGRTWIAFPKESGFFTRDE